MWSPNALRKLLSMLTAAAELTYGIETYQENGNIEILRVSCLGVHILFFGLAFLYGINLKHLILVLFLLDVCLFILKYVRKLLLKRSYYQDRNLLYMVVFNTIYILISIYITWRYPCVHGVVTILWIYMSKLAGIKYCYSVFTCTYSPLHLLADWRNVTKMKRLICSEEYKYIASDFFHFFWKIVHAVGCMRIILFIIVTLYKDYHKFRSSPWKSTTESMERYGCSFHSYIEIQLEHSNIDLSDAIGINSSFTFPLKFECLISVTTSGINHKQLQRPYIRLKQTETTYENNRKLNKFYDICFEVRHAKQKTLSELKVYVLKVSTESLIKISVPVSKNLISQDIRVYFYYIYGLHHIGSDITRCLNCESPIKMCETSKKVMHCYITFYVHHKNTYGDYQIVILYFSKTLQRYIQFFYPQWIRLLPTFDYEVLEYIPELFVSSTKMKALKLLQNETALQTESNVASLIYTIESEVELISGKTVQLIYLCMYSCFLVLFLKVGRSLFIIIESTEESLGEDGKVYDVFVSYTDADVLDRKFTGDFLLPFLTNCGLNVRSCDDIQPGGNLTKQHFKEISKCKKILIVWSFQYEEDATCYELQFNTVIAELYKQNKISKEDIFVFKCDACNISLECLYLLRKRQVYDLPLLALCMTNDDCVKRTAVIPLVTNIIESLKQYQKTSICKQFCVGYVSILRRLFQYAMLRWHIQSHSGFCIVCMIDCFRIIFRLVLKSVMKVLKSLLRMFKV